MIFDKITPREVNGNHYVWIPKFYFRASEVFYISEEPVGEMELHPAFMRNGDVLDGFYVGAYECSADEATGGVCIAPNQKPIVGETPITFKRRIQNSDMHCINIYERIAVLTLALFETTTATRSLQESFGSGDSIQDARLIANTGTTNNVYRHHGIITFLPQGHWTILVCLSRALRRIQIGSVMSTTR